MSHHTWLDPFGNRREGKCLSAKSSLFSREAAILWTSLQRDSGAGWGAEQGVLAAEEFNASLARGAGRG